MRVESRREPFGLVTRFELGAENKAPPNQTESHWALLADPHISSHPSSSYLGFFPERNLRKAAEQVAAAQPELALIAGDLAWEEGLPGDYARFRELIDPIVHSVPACLTVGNHDSRERFLAMFDDRFNEGGTPEKSIVVVNQPSARLILLDSLFRTDVVPGLLGKAQRHWLRNVLGEDNQKPTFLCVHHPLDEEDDSLLDADRLLRFVRPFRNVKAIFHGHDHIHRFDRFEDIPIISLPAVGFPFEETETLGWVEARITARGGDFRLHVVAGDLARDGEAKSFEWRK